MRIVHLLQSQDFSGAENVVCQIISLFNNDSNFEMIYVSPNGSIREVLRNKQIDYYPLCDFTQSSINRAIMELNPQIVQAHDFNASVRASFQRNASVISHLHNNALWLSKLCVNSIAYRCCVPNFESIIGVSNAIYNEYIFRRSIKDKFTCLPNVVDGDVVWDKAKEKELEKIDILDVGRLAEPKNPLKFLDIVKEIIFSYIPNIRIVMVGTGPLKFECEKKIANYGLQNNVKMVGFDSNPYKYMNSAKIIIMPSIYEGFGLVAVEAMILGKVVLASPVGGLVDILGDGSGVLCDNNEEFVKKAVFYLSDDTAYKNISSRALEKSKIYTDVKQYKETLKSIYFRIGEKYCK